MIGNRSRDITGNSYAAIFHRTVDQTHHSFVNVPSLLTSSRFGDGEWRSLRAFLTLVSILFVVRFRRPASNWRYINVVQGLDQFFGIHGKDGAWVLDIIEGIANCFNVG